MGEVTEPADVGERKMNARGLVGADGAMPMKPQYTALRRGETLSGVSRVREE